MQSKKLLDRSTTYTVEDTKKAYYFVLKKLKKQPILDEK
jgi:hypothetical protein